MKDVKRGAMLLLTPSCWLVLRSVELPDDLANIYHIKSEPVVHKMQFYDPPISLENAYATYAWPVRPFFFCCYLLVCDF